MAFRKKNFKRRAPKRRVYKKKGVKKPALKRMVMKMIGRTEEVKTVQSGTSVQQLYSALNANLPLNVIQVGPNATTLPIVQGVAQDGRIGNKIRTKRLVFKGVLNPDPQLATSNDNPRPVLVRMIMYYDRGTPTTVPTTAGTTMFQNGSSTAGFTGNMTDMIRDYNTDKYRILKKKTFKLGYSQYAGTATSVVNQGVNQAYSNNDFKLACPFSMDLTSCYPKVVQFNDNNADPRTRGLYCLWYYVAADGSTLGAPYIAAQVSYNVSYTYTDA